MGNIISKGLHWKSFSRKRCRRSLSMSGTSPTGVGGFPLRLTREGEWVRIVAVDGGRNIHERLAGFGLRIGSEVQVLNNAMNGKILLGHQGARFYLGGGMAHKIRVVGIRGGKR